MAEQRQKAVDEMFCRNCGVRIKKAAEFCPNCGTANEMPTAPPRRSPNSTDRGTTSRSSPDDTTRVRQSERSGQYQPSVSENWWYGVAGGTALWAFLLVLVSVAPNGGGAFAGFLVLLAWVGLPVAAYYDIKYVRATSDWRPSQVLWVVLLAVWILNVVVGAAYLYQRHEKVGTP
ncbi:zinc ribbon domain-containing protein [Haloarchaeobius baliensis]|uniref:zinc ribbon domain-containing protein n=1 Tax=Haloarchaeobius baliensis TaxID=1670458 RepID=UPI003F880721